MTIQEIGCCGAYCKTCPALITRTCRGCTLGYDCGERDIALAKCKIKVCCFNERGYETCADCPDYLYCEILNGFYSKKGYKYRKYRQALEFIQENGYAKFTEIADTWKGPYGKFE